jgi:hypothetical protein
LTEKEGCYNLRIENGELRIIKKNGWIPAYARTTIKKVPCQARNDNKEMDPGSSPGRQVGMDSKSSLV